MKFILLSFQRTGTHLFRRYIRSHSQLDCLTEWYFIEPEPESLMEVINNLKDYQGVTVFGKQDGYDDMPMELPLVILLRKNKFEQALSHCLMNWRWEFGDNIEDHFLDYKEVQFMDKVEIDLNDFKRTYEFGVNNTEEILNRTKNCSREIFWYEDIIPKNQEGWIANMPEEENRTLCNFLGVEYEPLSAISKRVGRYHTVINYNELYNWYKEII